MNEKVYEKIDELTNKIISMNKYIQELEDFKRTVCSDFHVCFDKTINNSYDLHNSMSSFNYKNSKIKEERDKIKDEYSRLRSIFEKEKFKGRRKKIQTLYDRFRNKLFFNTQDYQCNFCGNKISYFQGCNNWYYKKMAFRKQKKVDTLSILFY